MSVFGQRMHQRLSHLHCQCLAKMLLSDYNVVYPGQHDYQWLATQLPKYTVQAAAEIVHVHSGRHNVQRQHNSANNLSAHKVQQWQSSTHMLGLSGCPCSALCCTCL